jgi:hypothetical protein
MHTDPEVLALVALGERGSATAEDLDHIAHCAACGREVDELGHLAGVGRTVSDHFTLETPSPEVWNRIRANLGFDDAFSSPLLPAATDPPVTDPPVTDPPAATTGSPGAGAALHVVPDPPGGGVEPTRGSGSRRRILSLALAAVLALIVGIGGTLAWQRLREPREAVVAATPLAALPAWSGSTGEALLEQDSDGRRWLVVTVDPSRPVNGQQQVWLLKPDVTSMVHIGLLARTEQRFLLPPGVNVSQFPVVDVSDEPPTPNGAHSGNSIVRGTLPV